MAKKNKGRASSKRGAGGESKKFGSLAGKWKLFVILGILGLSSGIGIGLYFGISYLTTYGIGGPGATPTLTTSSFTFKSAVDGEDVSAWLEGTLYVPKDDTVFDETEDIYTLSLFEAEKSSADMEDISYDLRNVEYAWLKVDPDGETVFSTTYIKLIGGSNWEYVFEAYDQVTEVNFNIFDEDTMAAITVGDLSMSGGYVAVLDCLHNTTTAAQQHYGTNWDRSTSEFNELSATGQAWYHDEKNVAGVYPTYDLTVDLEKEYYSDLEKVTNAFCLKFDFNGSISTVNGEANQVNVSVASSYPVETVISGDLIYFIWYEGFDFESGAYTLYFDMDTTTVAGNVHLDDVDSGWIVVPRDYDSLGAFTKSSDIAT